MKFKNGDSVEWNSPRFGVVKGKLVDFDQLENMYYVEYELITAQGGNIAGVTLKYDWAPENELTKVKKKKLRTFKHSPSNIRSIR